MASIDNAMWCDLWQYHNKIFRRAVKDTAAQVDKILQAHGFPEVSMIKATLWGIVLVSVITYLITGVINLGWDNIIPALISAFSTLVAVLLYFCYNLIVAPINIDKEQEKDLSILKEQIETRKITKANYDKLGDYRATLIHTFLNYKPTEDHGAVKKGMAALQREIADFVGTNFSPFHGFRIRDLGAVPARNPDVIKNNAFEIDSRILDVLRIYEPERSDSKG